MIIYTKEFENNLKELLSNSKMRPIEENHWKFKDIKKNEFNTFDRVLIESKNNIVTSIFVESNQIIRFLYKDSKGFIPNRFEFETDNFENKIKEFFERNDINMKIKDVYVIVSKSVGILKVLSSMEAAEKAFNYILEANPDLNDLTIQTWSVEDK